MLYASGECNPKRNYYTQGWYTSKLTNNCEFYSSSYELKYMNLLDTGDMPWTKKHKIIIPYTDLYEVNRYYIPDFLVGDLYLDEVKPSVLVDSYIDNNILKIEAARKYCDTNNLIFRIITEKELEI